MSEENLKLWNELKSVPKEAKKAIFGGRLKGMTDIKPQWRLQMMTEQFGPIGFGWYYLPTKTWKEEYTEQVSVYVEINLFIRTNGLELPAEWSAPVYGVGGSFIVAKEKAGPFHSDEAYKMATTDALSVAMKQLGVAADVYMGLSDSKYDKPSEESSAPSNSQPFNEYKKETSQKMTGKQKGTLRDQVITLDKLGTESTNAAILAVNKALNGDMSFEQASHLINKVKLTIEKDTPQ